MNVCFDLSAAANEKAGLGRYASQLALALLKQGAEMTAFVNNLAESHLQPPLSDLPVLTAGLPRKRWRLRAAASYFGAPALDPMFPGLRLFHATEHLLPRLKRARSVFTLHDTAYIHLPQYHLPRNRFYLRLMMPRFLAASDAVITVSEHTRRDAQRWYKLPDDRLHVIPEGVEDHFRPISDASLLAAVRERYQLPQRFILFVGTIEPRKNLVTLLEAYAAMRADGRNAGIGLVIAGGKGWLYETFFERLRALGLQDVVRLTGYVPEADLPALLNCAELFAFPSSFEGFGLPPLEAMACGVPVVCSNATSLPEVVGEAGLLVPPDDCAAWTRGARASAVGRWLTVRAARARAGTRPAVHLGRGGAQDPGGV